MERNGMVIIENDVMLTVQFYDVIEAAALKVNVYDDDTIRITYSDAVSLW